MTRITTLILLFSICTCVYSQPVFDLYKKLEASYENSAFEECLKLESQLERIGFTKLDTITANTLFYLGDAHNQLGNVDKAIAYFEREKDIRQQLGDPEYYSTSLFNLASAYLQAGQYAKAGTYADELLEIDKKFFGENSSEFAASAMNVADIYIQIDRFRDAEKLLIQTIRRQAKNTVSHGLLLNKLGDLYTYTGQFSKAASALQNATDILFLQAGESSAEYTTAAINLGILYMRQGKYPEAEEIFDVALGIISPSEVSYASVLNNQALVYQSLGQLDRAEQIFVKIKSLDSASIGTNHPDYAITLSNLGLVLAGEAKYNEAEKAMTEALRIQKSNNESRTVSYARKLNNLAKIYQLSGKSEKAIAPLEEAASIFKKNLTENNHEYATAIFNLGNAYWRAGKGAAGIKYLKASAVIRAKVLGKKHPKYAESLQKIAEYQWEQKQFKDARQSFGEVFDNYYFQLDVTFPGLTEEEKSRFYYSNIKDGFEKFNSFAVLFSKSDPQLIGEMYDHHINTKGAIMYATEKVKRAIQASKDSVLINLFVQWHDQKEKIARAYSQNQDISKLDSLVTEASNLEKELTKRSAEFAGQFARKKYSWQDIKKALKPGEGSVEVFRYKVYTPDKGGNFTENVAYAFILVTSSSDSPELLLMENGKDLEGKFLKYYHNNIRFNLDDNNSFKNFFAPVGEMLKRNNVSKCYFSPDGVYNQLNINSLLNPDTKNYVIDEFDLRLITNSKELLETESFASTQAPVLIGFPKFNMQRSSDPNTTKNEVKVTRGGNLTRSMRGLLRFMRGNEGITELPGTEKEINEISRLFSQQPQVFMSTQATEDVAKEVNNPGYLHIATHGYFLEDEEGTDKSYVANPLLKAGLILAGSENFLITGQPVNDAGDDGILTAYEAMNLRLDDTKLVVLSACETGLGEVKNGEGVYGLQRAFKLAGAQSIVMSLWSVDDEATQELMSTFYAELLKTGKQHESFRTAQQKIKEKYKKPFYWGAFIMVGI